MRDDWSTLRKLMFQRLAAGGSLSENEVTGNPAVFQTNVAKPLTGFTIPFTPVQTGSGDPSPQNQRPIIGWQGLTAFRGGINLFDQEYLSDFSNYKNLISYYYYTDNIQLKPNTTYTLTPSSKEKLGTNAYYVLRINDSGGQGVSTVAYPVSAGKPTQVTFTTGESGTIQFGTNRTELPLFMSVDWMLNYGSEPENYVPYQTVNSYPVTFPALGKNLLNAVSGNDVKSTSASFQNYTISDGSVNVTGGVVMGFKVKCKPNTQYAFSLDSSYVGNNLTLRVYEHTTEPTAVSGGTIIVNTSNTEQATFTTSADAEWLVCGFYVTTGQGEQGVTVSNFMLNTGNQAEPYEPFDNTIYGGTLDAVNGVLTVTQFGFDPQNYMSFLNSTDPNVSVFQIYVNQDIKPAKNGWIISNRFSTNISSGIAGRMVFNAINLWFVVPTSELETVDSNGMKKWFQTHETVFVYNLATPIEIPLDPITVQTLVGDNTIWTDTNGSNTIKYKKKG